MTVKKNVSPFLIKKLFRILKDKGFPFDDHRSSGRIVEGHRILSKNKLYSQEPLAVCFGSQAEQCLYKSCRA